MCTLCITQEYNYIDFILLRMHTFICFLSKNNLIISSSLELECFFLNIAKLAFYYLVEPICINRVDMHVLLLYGLASSVVLVLNFHACVLGQVNVWSGWSLCHHSLLHIYVQIEGCVSLRLAVGNTCLLCGCVCHFEICVVDTILVALREQQVG